MPLALPWLTLMQALDNSAFKVCSAVRLKIPFGAWALLRQSVRQCVVTSSTMC